MTSKRSKSVPPPPLKKPNLLNKKLSSEMKDVLEKVHNFLYAIRTDNLKTENESQRNQLWTLIDIILNSDHNSVIIAEKNMVDTYETPLSPTNIEEEANYVTIDSDNENDTIPEAQIVGTSANILNSQSDHKGWIMRQEGLFKSSRYWALIYKHNLYMYHDFKDQNAYKILNLKGAQMKVHKKGLNFVLTVKKGDKDKNYQMMTEQASQTPEWVQALQMAISTATDPTLGSQTLVMQVMETEREESEPELEIYEDNDYEQIDVETQAMRRVELKKSVGNEDINVLDYKLQSAKAYPQNHHPSKQKKQPPKNSQRPNPPTLPQSRKPTLKPIPPLSPLDIYEGTPTLGDTGDKNEKGYSSFESSSSDERKESESDLDTYTDNGHEEIDVEAHPKGRVEHKNNDNLDHKYQSPKHLPQSNYHNHSKQKKQPLTNSLRPNLPKLPPPRTPKVKPNTPISPIDIYEDNSSLGAFAKTNRDSNSSCEAEDIHDHDTLNPSQIISKFNGSVPKRPPSRLKKNPRHLEDKPKVPPPHPSQRAGSEPVRIKPQPSGMSFNVELAGLIGKRNTAPSLNAEADSSNKRNKDFH